MRGSARLEIVMLRNISSSHQALPNILHQPVAERSEWIICQIASAVLLFLSPAGEKRWSVPLDKLSTFWPLSWVLMLLLHLPGIVCHLGFISFIKSEGERALSQFPSNVAGLMVGEGE